MTLKECMMRLEIDSQHMPVKKQIEEYAENEEGKNNRIPVHQEDKHTYAKLASKLGKWEESVDCK